MLIHYDFICTAVHFQMHCGMPIAAPQCKFRYTAVHFLPDFEGKKKNTHRIGK